MKSPPPCEWIKVHPSVLMLGDWIMLDPEDQFEYVVSYNGFMRDSKGKSYEIPKTAVWLRVKPSGGHRS